MMNDIHVLESIPAYVLGSLDAQEARLVAEHLAGCYICRNELDMYQMVADQMLLILPDVPPPAGLKSRLVERVHSLEDEQMPESAARRSPVRFRPTGVLAGLLLFAILAISTMVFLNSKDRLVISGPLGMRAIALQNSSSAPGASGFVVMAADGKNGVLVVDKL